MAAEEKKIGRPSDYTEELAEVICLRLAEGESLRSVCRDDGMPSKQAVLRWLARNESFRAQYVRAKEEGAEELFDIADDGTNDWMEKLDKDGEAIGYQLNGEHVQRSKLRIDTRKWYLSKIMPKKYGDRIQHEQKITITDLSDEELDRRLMELTNAQSQSGTED
ncbi:TPA_asm: DNA packaging protein [Salmonella enterica]|uniref:DNA packaging protein n=1 Tax=Salmonella enterica TaxID=28901 RepID=A0A720ZK14_SALER|nr:DNA packaging protein [Salmonella enterica]NJF95218.1 DNA packaging protein [Salmonella enterica subsp. enterica serovar Anatum]NJG08719.1 DNA packaging protein [Salmonella enterica subsp. enterica serovar Anatum]HAD8110446.1 DNA packaging protein [Salmonella enterica]HAD8160767.1 DNA packaging protein [Salmonella enterica]HAD8169963.1 DNA packaging protein [Salmonella enterica]